MHTLLLHLFLECLGKLFLSLSFHEDHSFQGKVVLSYHSAMISCPLYSSLGEFHHWLLGHQTPKTQVKPVNAPSHSGPTIPAWPVEPLLVWSGSVYIPQASSLPP